MGQLQSSEEFESFKVHYKYQGHSLTVKIADSIKEPDLDMPNASEITRSFEQALKGTDLNDKDQLRALGNDIKWNLFRKHKKALDIAMEEEDDVIQEDKGEYFAELFNSKCLLSDLMIFHDWLDEDNAEDISNFLSNNGIHILITHLGKALQESTQTFDFNKQVLLLRILTKLFTRDEVKEEIGTYQFMLNSIVMNLSPVQVEVTSIVVDLLTDLLWHSDAAFDIVFRSLEFFQQKKNFSYLFEPLIRVIEDSDNVVMINIICQFINSIVEAPSSQQKRIELKENLLVHGISVVYGDVRLKISDNEYRQRSCGYERVIRSIRQKRMLDQPDIPVEPMEMDSNSFGKVIFIEDNEDDAAEFENQINSVLRQIEAFEELLKEIDDDEEDSDSESQPQDSQRSSSKPSKVQSKVASKLASPYRTLVQTPAESPRNGSQSLTGREKKVQFVPQINIQTAPSTQKYSRQKSITQTNLNQIEDAIGMHRKPLLGQQRKSLLNIIPMNQNNAHRVSVSDINLSQLFLPDKTLQAIHELNRKIKPCKNAQELLQQMESFVKVSQQSGVDIINKLVDHITAKFKEFDIQGSFRGRSDSRVELESQVQSLSEKSLYLELEISKLSDEKRNLQMDLQRLKENQPVVDVNGKQIDIKYIQQQVKILQEGLIEAHKLALNNKKVKVLSKQVEDQRAVIDELKRKLSLVALNSSEISNEKMRIFQEEMKNAYESKIQSLEQQCKKVVAETKFTSSILNKTKDNLKKKVEELNLKIVDLEAKLKLQQSNSLTDIPMTPQTPQTPSLVAPPPPPPPPPPPLVIDGSQQQQQQRERRQPTQPMKSVQWNQLKKQNVKGTLWENMDDSTIQLDYDYLEEWFAQKTSAPALMRQTTKIIVKESNLRPERAKNVELVLCRLKASHAAIMNGLWSLDESILTSETVDALTNILPNEQEAAIFLSNKQLDKTKLAIPDLFFMEIVKIPGYDARLYALRAMNQYKNVASELQDKMRRIGEAFEQYKNDEFLKNLLLNTLAVGNFMNGKTKRGDSYGFKITDIDKIYDVRSTQDSNKTLLGYIVRLLEQQYPDIINVEESLAELEFLSKFQLSQFDVDVSEMKKDFLWIQKAISSQTKQEFDNVTKKLGNLPQKLNQDLQWLQEQSKNLNQKYCELCSFFCMEPKDISSDAFFAKIMEIKIKCREYKQILIREKQAKEREEERIKIQELKKKRLKETEQKQQTSHQTHQGHQTPSSRGAPRKSIMMDFSKVNDKQEILMELRSRQNSKQKNTLKTSNLGKLMEMQKKLKSMQG